MVVGIPILKHFRVVFDLTLPIFYSILDFIKINILTKFYED